jgi:hypothetical protein
MAEFERITPESVRDLGVPHDQAESVANSLNEYADLVRNPRSKRYKDYMRKIIEREQEIDRRVAAEGKTLILSTKAA